MTALDETLLCSPFLFWNTSTSSRRGHRFLLPRVYVIDLLLILYVPVSLPKSVTSRGYLHQPATRKSGTISPKLKEKTSICGRSNLWYVLSSQAKENSNFSFFLCRCLEFHFITCMYCWLNSRLNFSFFLPKLRVVSKSCHPPYKYLPYNSLFSFFN